MPKVGGRADGKRVSAAVRERLAGLDYGAPAAHAREHRRRGARRLRGLGAARPARPPRLRPPPARQRADPRRRRRRRADGGHRRRRAGRADRAGARDRPRHDRGGDRRPRRTREPCRDPRGRGLAPPQHQGRAEDGQPEALRRLDPPPHDHLRDRPGRHRQDLPRRRHGGRTRSPSARSSGSSSPAPRSRPASASASSPGTSRPRSTPTCGRSSTPSTTCSTPTASTAISSGA